MPTYDPRSDGSSLADWSLEAEVFCSYVQAWVGGSIVSIDRDSVTVEFDLEAGHCRKKLRNGSQNLRLPPATRRQLQAIQERLEPEEISESEYAAELPPQLERAGEQQAPAFRSEETEESASEQRQEDSGSLTEEIDPGANFLPAEATKHIMEYIFVKRSGKEMQGLDCSDCHPSMLTSLAEMFFGGHRCFESRHADKKGSSLLPVKSYKNNSYAITQAFRGPVEVHYRGPERGDILVKVYVLEGSRHDDWDEYTLATQEDGTPAFMHSQHRREPVRVPRALGSGTFFLGVVVHRDLNADWLWGLRDKDLRKQFLRSTEGGFEARGEAKGEKSAQKAAYVLSWATADRELNNPLVKLLVEQPVYGPHCAIRGKPEPITFCTDRSLGFGQHLISEKVGHDLQVSLYLAKHGFGKPVQSGEWLEEYLSAIMTVKCGMLILRQSAAYGVSLGCLRECVEVPRHNIFFVSPDHQVLEIYSLHEGLQSMHSGVFSTAMELERQRELATKASRGGHDGLAVQCANNAAKDEATRLMIAGWVRSRSGDNEEALALVEKAFATLCSAGVPRLKTLVLLAELRLATGNVEGAEAALAELPYILWVDEALPETKWPLFGDRVTYVQCATYLSAGRLPEAMKYLWRLAESRLKGWAMQPLLDNVRSSRPSRQWDKETMLHYLVQLMVDYWLQWGFWHDRPGRWDSGTRALLPSLKRQLQEPTPRRLLLIPSAYKYKGWTTPASDWQARYKEAVSRGFHA